MDLIKKLNDDSRFTNAELDVVRFMREHPSEVVNMPISALAEKTYSSNPVIVRICRKLDLKGYKEFKIEYAKHIESSKYTNKDVDFSRPFTSEESKLEVINGLSSLYKESIDLVNSHLDPGSLDKVAELLRTSERVFIYANGDTCISAEGFVNKMRRHGYFFHIADTQDKQFFYSQHVTPQDCILFITYESCHRFVDHLVAARKKGCRTVTITSSSEHPMVKSSTCSITLPHNEGDGKIATFYSQLAFTYILSILYSLIYQKK